MSAKKLLKLVQEAGLLDKSALAEVKQQMATKMPSAEALAKALVDKGYLTRFQATKFVSMATDDSEKKPAEPEKPAAAPSGDDLLGLAPLDDDPEEEPAPPPAAAAPEEEEVVMLEDAGDALTPVEDAGAGLTPVGAPAGLSPIESEPPSSGLEGLDQHEPADPFSGGGGGAPSGVQLPRPRKKKGNVWETKLMFGGGMALLLLIIIGAVLYINLTATPADEMWAQAMEDYRNGSYSQAQALMEEFLDDYPDDENASEARVRVALAKIRTVLRDPQKGLDRANELLPQIETEDSFSVARSELANILIEIPQGFVAKAKQTDNMQTKEELADKADLGMGLVNESKYVPTSSRGAIQTDITRTQEDINLVRRDINQDKDLRAAIQNINGAAESSRTAEAYDIYKKLLKNYPALARDSELLEAVRSVTERETRLVEVVDEPLEATTEAAPPGSEFRVVLATRAGGDISRLENQTIAALIEGTGTVYGLDAGSGKILWSRFVGHETSTHPTPVSKESGSDLLIVDGRRNDLLRIKPRDGAVVWRLSLGERFAGPVMGGRKLLVSTESGKIREIDPETGTSPRHAVVPQPLSVAPAADATRGLLFQVGHHSNLYVLNSETLECVDVFYLAHKAGTVVAPPLPHLGHLFTAVNTQSSYAELQALAVNAEGQPILETAQKPARLRGNVVVPLRTAGRRLLAVTDRGEAVLYDIDMNKKPPATQAASLAPTHQKSVRVFPLTDAGALWLADDRLTKYRMQVTTKQINREKIAQRGYAFVAPLQLLGDVLIYTARPPRSTGVEVAAVQIDNPAKALWSTRLGVPAGRVTVDEASRSISVITSAASLFAIDRNVLGAGVNDKPVVTARSRSGSQSFTKQIALSEGRVAFFNPAAQDELLLYLPQASRKLKVVALDLPEAEVTATPVAFQDGLVASMSNGDVILLDAETGQPLAKPFRPRLEPGEVIQWRRAAVAGDQVVVADDRGSVYRLAIKDSPEPHLAQVATNKLDVPLDSDLAVAGDTVYAVLRTSGGDVVISLGLAELKAAKEFDLEGKRVTWGPVAIQDRVLLVADDNQLHCFGAEQKAVWENPAAAYGKPAGPPLVDGADYVFAAHNGAVWRVSIDSGKEVQQLNIGQSLGSSPVKYGSKLLLCGNDGSVHVIPMPSGS